MNNRLAMFFAIIFFSSHAMAYELEGTLTDTGGDGSYTVSLENDEGHVYNGNASQLADGTLKVHVDDGNGETYSGLATKDETGIYNFNLKNDVSGDPATGTLEEIDEY